MAAAMSSIITPKAPFTFLSSRLTGQGLKASKIRNNIKAAMNPATVGVKKAMHSHIPATSSITTSLGSSRPVACRYLCVEYVPMIKAAAAAKSSAYTPPDL